MATGQILQFDDVRGYGFIAPDGGGDDVFVHVNDLIGEKMHYRPGAKVVFRLETNERGPKASEVVLQGQRQVAPLSELEDDEVSDVLTGEEYRSEVTEALLVVEPPLTGPQILQCRQRLQRLAQEHGWVTA